MLESVQLPLNLIILLEKPIFVLVVPMNTVQHTLLEKDGRKFPIMNLIYNISYRQQNPTRSPHSASRT